MSDLDKTPGNSIKSKEGQKKTIQPVAQGRKAEKKKSNVKQVVSSLFDASLEGQKLDLTNDVIIPSMKRMVLEAVGSVTDAVRHSFELALFGRVTNKTSTIFGNGYVNYGSQYRAASGSTYTILGSENKPVREISQQGRRMHDFSEIVFSTRRDASNVLDQLAAALEKYPEVTVADFYTAAGVSSSFQDRNYGWKNLSQAYPARVRDGFILVMPAPEYLK